ncbi:MAG TPA: hypothetical protein DIW43_08355 [Spongiibacteraceae bacterium]|nr:hypothetical protein [Spongiibacteraceae bacterium]HCS27453.1 hypothetical protein [Spongiibacteraceae bacterium]|tara:strand:+ start:208 stop:654 length:447 start_codon:yes stop_codon:yes gene_type:complete
MKRIFVLATIVLSGCASLSENVALTSNGIEPSKVLIYREGSFHAGGASLYVGKDEQYFLKLKNDQYSQFFIDSGRHLLQAKASGSPASTLELDLLPGQTTCVKARPNAKSLGAILIPIVGNMVPTFMMENVSCPTQEEISEYEFVEKS